METLDLSRIPQKTVKIMKIIEIQEIYIFPKISTNQDSSKNNSQKTNLIGPTPPINRPLRIQW